LSDLDLLRNDGVLALNTPTSPPPEKTVVVLGPSRSGTTMVASVLQALGVHMGERLGPVLEDAALSQAVEARDIARVKEIIVRRNAKHPLWGWKRPSALEYSDVWQGCFRYPYIIAIFRDPFAIANRNRISMLSDVFQNMERSVQHLGMLVNILRQHKGPVLLCSYEKVLASPETFVWAVHDFLDLNASWLCADAAKRIDPTPRKYLKTSRITNSSGYLDRADKRVCSGWAFYPKQPARAAKVQIFVNGRQVGTVTARLPRLDVKKKGLHPTGLCGFRLEWPTGTQPLVGDSVEARVEGDVKLLNGSPKSVREAGVH
jgi:hypothetical protein